MDDRGLAGRDGRGRRPPLARANGRIDDYRRALPEQRQGFLNREVSPFEIDGYHLVEALLCHVFEQQELAVTCIYENAVQVPELPLDRGEHRVEVREIADVRANGETSGSERLLSRLQRPLIQAADGDARKTIASAISLGAAVRPNGVAEPSCSNESRSVPAVPSVRVGPGATVLTRIPLAPNAAAQDRVNDSSADLAAR